MNQVRIKFIYFLLLVCGLHAANTDPIVLIHGFLGWGREEISGTYYWGGQHDIEQYLRNKGYRVITVSLGPISSSYDCAVETFYQIKGGQLDYGQAHSKKYNLLRRPEGKKYEGMYPEWDENHPVHLMGYSFGGVTSRMLLYLLNNTFENDSTGSLDKSVLLGNSLPGWVSSITTMSTPHNGATISNIVTDIFPFTDNLLPVANMISSSYYDFDLDHWGISQKENESWPDYFMRLKNHTAWETKNNVGWDSNIQGAKELNDILTIDSSLYYFSYSTTASVLDPVTGYHIPDKHLSWTNYPLCWFMGRNVVDMGDGQTTDSTWFENDGTVNTISMIRPFTGKNGPEPMKIFSNSEPVETGIWHFMGKYQQDHKNFIGFFLDDKNLITEMMNRYENHARILYSLP
ncbi:MAG TPA: hypothetical protein EYO07_01280 [Candidatus Marinimicrobia bacterium]|nr:hypothetical protein [Candidatus Neomarinimicrobiota bacterium]